MFNIPIKYSKGECFDELINYVYPIKQQTDIPRISGLAASYKIDYSQKGPNFFLA